LRRAAISKPLRSDESVAVHGVTVVLDSAGRSEPVSWESVHRPPKTKRRLKERSRHRDRKTFRKQPDVASVKVDLRKKTVTITTKPGKTLGDAKIQEVVTYSGYTMGKIVRERK
jgi:copper chaperone CopZ